MVLWFLVTGIAHQEATGKMLNMKSYSTRLHVIMVDTANGSYARVVADGSPFSMAQASISYAVIAITLRMQASKRENTNDS